MKKLFFFSAITIAMIFVLSSCQKECLTCGYNPPPQQVYNPPTKMVASEKVIKDAASFTDGYLWDCPTSMRFEVRDVNGNNPEYMNCTDSLVFKRANYNYGGWNYQNGPCRVGGKGDAVVMAYPDGTLAETPGYPKAINLRVTEFYGR